MRSAVQNLLEQRRPWTGLNRRKRFGRDNPSGCDGVWRGAVVMVRMRPRCHSRRSPTTRRAAPGASSCARWTAWRSAPSATTSSRGCRCCWSAATAVRPRSDLPPRPAQAGPPGSGSRGAARGAARRGVHPQQPPLPGAVGRRALPAVPQARRRTRAARQPGAPPRVPPFLFAGVSAVAPSQLPSAPEQAATPALRLLARLLRGACSVRPPRPRGGLTRVAGRAPGAA